MVAYPQRTDVRDEEEGVSDVTELSRCGIRCDECAYREKMNCPGCHASQGALFWGECRVAACSIRRRLNNCGECSSIPCQALRDFSYDAEQGDNGRRIRNLLQARDGIDPLIAVCGVSCTECHAYAATQADDEAALTRIAAEWTAGLGKTYTADDIRCDGCRTHGRRLSGYCSTCEIKACAEGKANRTCGHCATGPCDKIVAPEARDAIAALQAQLKTR